MANYYRRKIPYFEDKPRYESIYMSDYIKKLKEESYNKPKDDTLKSALNKYEYSENPTVLKMLSDKKLMKNEPFIRESFAKDAESIPRKTAFSSWCSSYDYENTVTEAEKNAGNFRASSIDEHFRPRYHKYHPAYYATEGTQYHGLYAQDPFEKFFLHSQPKIHSSNYKIGLGTTKPTTAFIPGYGGFIPVNRFEFNQERIKDPYFNTNKTNHILNFSGAIPNYQGYQSPNVVNMKSDAKGKLF